MAIVLATNAQADSGVDVVHGDVKPQNVLIFSDDPNVERYTTQGRAKLTDFGYSCFGTRDSDLVYLPFSNIWSAPEYHDRAFELSAAKKVDIFSFGLTAVYLLFYWEVWDVKVVYPAVPQMRKIIKDGSMRRKIQEAIRDFYKDEVQGEPQGAALLRFFDFTLAHEADSRETDLESLITLLRQSRYYHICQARCGEHVY